MNHKPTLVLGAAMILATGWVVVVKRDPEAPRTPNLAHTPASTPTPTAPPPPAAAAPPAPAVENFSDFALRPFAVTRRSENHEWTEEDGKLPGVIRKLAHNRLEEQKMLGENPAVYRRQLVYRKQAATDLVKEAERSGIPLQTVPVPGFDGTEWMIEVYKVDSVDGGSEGTIYGRLPGQPNSLVTLTFIGPSECFSLLSPDQDLYIQGDPREPGEIIVKKINPSMMGGEEGGHPDLYDVGATTR